MWELPSVVCKVNKYSRLIKRPCLISGLETAFGALVRKTALISGRSVRVGCEGAEGGAVPKFFYEVFTVVENVVIKFLTCFVTL